jgi:hypothetical protein
MPKSNVDSPNHALKALTFALLLDLISKISQGFFEKNKGQGRVIAHLFAHE